MRRETTVYDTVRDLYENSATSMGRWMWKNHVQKVAHQAQELAKKYGADEEKTYCSALVHDIGDAKYGRYDTGFKVKSEELGRKILLDARFSAAETDQIIDVIIAPHSCRVNNLPTTLEGKVLSTADALWHLQTSFFPMFCYKNRPENISSYEGWQDWADEKLQREFNIKIFFEDERKLAQADYEALYRVFGNKTLHSDEN